MMQVTADLTVAVGLFVLGVCEAVFGFRDGGVGEPLSGPLAAEVLVVAGLTLPLAWRRRQPLGALAVVAVALGSQVIFLSPSVPFAAGLVPLDAAQLRCGPSGRLARRRRARDCCWRGRRHVCGCAGDAGAGGDSVQRGRHRGCLAGGAVCG